MKKIEPELTKDLLEKCESTETIKEILKVESDYLEKLKELDEQFLQRDGNLYHLKLTHEVDKSLDISEQDYKRSKYDDLKKEYLKKAEKIFEEKYKPSPSFETIKNIEKYMKGFQAGYLMFKDDPQFAEKLQSKVQSKDNPYIAGFRMGGVQQTKEQLLSKNKDLQKGKDRERG